MSNHSNFFDTPQAAAIYKHALLKYYIPAWAGKVGSRSSGRRVIVYDAYSGPGRYGDDQPGSPELLVETAVQMANLRSVFTVFSEKDPTHCARLRELLVAKGVPTDAYEIREGALEAHIASVLSNAGDTPLFVFLDPFGLVGFERVVEALTSRQRPNRSRMLQPKTELLMNFSYEAVRRISGVVRSEKEYAGKQAQIDALDRALGGDWWHPLAQSETDGWIEQILREFADHVSKVTGYGYITAEVADSLTSKPAYELILFTAHPDGLWEMAEAMSFARRDWRKWVLESMEAQSGGQVALRGLEFEDNETAWVVEIAANLREILNTNPKIRIGQELGRVLGRTLGLAREKHIRSALRQLMTEGLIAHVPTGDLKNAYITRA